METKKSLIWIVQAGKGRTGVIIASWLQYNNEWPDADKALAFYAAARTHNQKGVTIPSQIRFCLVFLFCFLRPFYLGGTDMFVTLGLH